MEAEEEADRLEKCFGEPDFFQKYGDKAKDLQKELDDKKRTLNSLYTRWEELEAIKNGG